MDADFDDMFGSNLFLEWWDCWVEMGETLLVDEWTEPEGVRGRAWLGEDLT